MSTIRRQRWSWALSEKLMFAKVFWVKMAWLSTQQNCAPLRVLEGRLTLGFLKDLTYLAYLGKEFAKITKTFRGRTTPSLHSHWSYSIHFIDALEAWKHLHVPAERLQLSMILVARNLNSAMSVPRTRVEFWTIPDRLWELEGIYDPNSKVFCFFFHLSHSHLWQPVIIFLPPRYSWSVYNQSNSIRTRRALRVTS